ncbi:hypothetical protein B5P19_14760 [Clavibacter sepedonicus]|nr:hypothetical protein B5P19_14760 [Clavibacter sepedonicus]OQJ54972.1 hypothetical protein B5P20_13340 [Clavibacter sepedonicus]
MLAVAAIGALTGLMLLPADPSLGSSAADRLADALSGDGTILRCLGGLIVYGGFAFVVQLRESEESGGVAYQRLLRHGSPARWARSRTAHHVRAAAAYLATIAAAGLAVAMSTGSAALLPDADRLALLACHFAVGGMLQLSAYSTGTLVVAWLARGAAAGLITIAVIVAGGALQLRTSTWLPVQLADMAVTRGGWDAVGQATLTLALAAALLRLALSALVRTVPHA